MTPRAVPPAVFRWLITANVAAAMKPGKEKFARQLATLFARQALVLFAHAGGTPPWEVQPAKPRKKKPAPATEALPPGAVRLRNGKVMFYEHAEGFDNLSTGVQNSSKGETHVPTIP